MPVESRRAKFKKIQAIFVAYYRAQPQDREPAGAHDRLNGKLDECNWAVIMPQIGCIRWLRSARSWTRFCRMQEHFFVAMADLPVTEICITALPVEA
jgi:hypothetical protein